MDNLGKAPCKEWTTLLAGPRNPEFQRGGILRHREAEDRRPPGDVVEPEGKAESADLGPAAGCLPVADSSPIQQASLLRSSRGKPFTLSLPQLPAKLLCYKIDKKPFLTPHLRCKPQHAAR